jgi:hypothetical protein
MLASNSGSYAQWLTIDDFADVAPPPKKPVDFYREKVTMKISNGYLEVEGIYYFRNNTGKSKNFPIVYPFPIDDYHHAPDSISIQFDNGEENKNIEFGLGKSAESVHCLIPLALGDSNIMTAMYRQKLKDKKARYILTTTSYWGKPFEYAEYHVFVPLSFDSVYVNYRSSSEIVNETERHYYFSGNDFMPDKDLIVKWR